MPQHVCVINNGVDIDFVNVLKATKTPVEVTVLQINDLNILDRLNTFKNNNALDAIILTGSSNRRIVNDTEPVQLPPDILELGVPVLGICYGYHWMINAKGGTVSAHADGIRQSYSKYIAMGAPLIISLKRYIFDDYEHVSEIPTGWTSMLRHQDMTFIAYDSVKGHFGVQFYPEKNQSTSVEFYRSWLNWAKNYKMPAD